MLREPKSRSVHDEFDFVTMACEKLQTQVRTKMSKPVVERDADRHELKTTAGPKSFLHPNSTSGHTKKVVENFDDVESVLDLLFPLASV